RQSAEGRAGEVAAHQSEGALPRRADARHRRRREAGDLRADRPARVRRAGHRARVVGAAGSPRPLRSHPRAARRADHRRVRARRGHAGKSDGLRHGSCCMKISTAAVRAYSMVLALIAIWIFFEWRTDGVFMRPVNLANLLKQMSVTGVLAVGMLFVIVARQIDLSVGSLVGLAGGLAAMTPGRGLVPCLPSA